MPITSPVPAVPQQARPVSEPATLDALATGCSATDLMVFRQVEPGRFLQLGGTGRGAGWAGTIELAVAAEPALRAALAGDVVRWAGSDPVPVLGPYHARSAALVAIDHDVAVLLGSDAGRLRGTDDDLRRTAIEVMAQVGAVSPAKRLADELEVVAAVRSTMHCSPGTLDDALRHVTASAAEALGCEVGIGWLPREGRLVVVERGWSLGADDEALRTALATLPPPDLPVCCQDSMSDPLPGPLGPSSGVRSHFVLPFGEPANGLLVLLHTVVTPRGFSLLCRTVGERVAEAAGVVVGSAAMREELVRLVAAAERSARLDPLTGLVNRLGWQEALASGQADVAAGAPASVLVMDLNGLKGVNDAHGHEAGDEYLRRASLALRGAAREADVVARLGGDEFGVLVAGAGPEHGERLVERLRAALADAAPVAGVALSAAVGVAGCPAVPTLLEAFRAADAAMYADKRSPCG